MALMSGSCTLVVTTFTCLFFSVPLACWPSSNNSGAALSSCSASLPKKPWAVRMPCCVPGFSQNFPSPIMWWRSTTARTCRLEKRSEEHTSELQSQSNLVCRLLLEKKKHRRAQPDHRLHVGAVHVHLAAMAIDDLER